MTAGRLLADAWHSLKRNQAPLGLYVLLLTAVNLLYRLASGHVEGFVEPDALPSWYPIYAIAADLFLAAGFSAVQAVVFAMFGREIDRPLWKCEGPGDALRRFFIVWFILNLVILTVIRLQVRAAEADAAQVVIALDFLMLGLYLFALPVGACVMYWGRLNWEELGESLAPIARQFPLVVVVLAINFGQYILHLILVDLLPQARADSPIVLAIADIPFHLLDCFAFAAMWRICMLHRDTSYEDIVPPPM